MTLYPKNIGTLTQRPAAGNPGERYFISGSNSNATVIQVEDTGGLWVPVTANAVSAPTDYSSCIGWYEAAVSNVTLDNTGTPSVRQWTDLSGHSNHFGMVTKALQPVWNSSNADWGNLPTLDFQAAHILSSSTTVSLTTFTMVFAVQSKIVATIFLEQTNNLNNFSNGSFVYTGTNATMSTKRGGTSSGKDNAYGNSWGTLYGGYPTLWGWQYNGTHASHRFIMRNMDERMNDQAANDPGTGTATDYIYLGARGNAQPVTSPSLQFSGSVAAMAIFTPALRTDQLFRVMRYFSANFNVGM